MSTRAPEQPYLSPHSTAAQATYVVRQHAAAREKQRGRSRHVAQYLCQVVVVLPRGNFRGASDMYRARQPQEAVLPAELVSHRRHCRCRVAIHAHTLRSR